MLQRGTSSGTVQRARAELTKPRRLGQGSWSTSVRLVLAICGYSGAGKTTLIERLLPRLAARGLRVGVVKHDSHQLDLDPAGKDTARFFAAGAAAVCAHDPTQHFVRTRESGSVPLTDVLPGLPADLDLVLVEGHKDSALPKLVLEHPEPRPTIDTGQVIGRLALSDQRLDQAEQLVASWLDDAWRTRPLGIALFIGGSASDGSGDSASFDIPSVERLVAQLRPCGDRLLLVGGGAESFRPGLSPVLPDVPGLEGPLAGLLGLLRYDPERAWLCVACDQPGFGARHVQWLAEQRRPAVWAVLPRLGGGGVEPFGAIYEPTLLPPIERAVARGTRAPQQVIAAAPIAHPEPPAELLDGWRNVVVRSR